MQEGACDALLLAYAGVHRMGYESLIVSHLPIEEFTPAVGQGSVTVEISDNLAAEKVSLISRAINHKDTEMRLLAERAFLRKMNGGCSIPVYALAVLENDILVLTGGIISLDGQEMIREKVTGPISDAVSLGEALGDCVLEKGGARILKEIREAIKAGFAE